MTRRGRRISRRGGEKPLGPAPQQKPPPPPPSPGKPPPRPPPPVKPDVGTIDMVVARKIESIKKGYQASNSLSPGYLQQVIGAFDTSKKSPDDIKLKYVLATQLENQPTMEQLIEDATKRAEVKTLIDTFKRTPEYYTAVKNKVNELYLKVLAEQAAAAAEEAAEEEAAEKPNGKPPPRGSNKPDTPKPTGGRRRKTRRRHPRRRTSRR